ncbi:hypothetical protein HQ865_12590 [Mucilaginibacter mali]|uniref:Uncharacterized protein n=1 Tax=Mucilaginibacter mali TaxID=2740462 RepID=A0A7D4UPI3_9SPHI|nr:hypothetical protein [Mucilaginibacter mali]QKJ30560.1 hypothetical protein HQ865_12590 [Mucilaginibacter mali]
MRKIELKAERVRTIDWYGDDIIDWAAFKLYSLDGSSKQLSNSYFAFGFNKSISSQNGEYAFIYQKFGTKGLLLKNRKLLREINRSYYFADAYEYPAAFITFMGNTYLVHCPKAYNQLDFEDVETGELITDVPVREPEDIFHSRLEVSPDQSTLISKGWLWHPLDVVATYRVPECIANPKLLDADANIFNYVGTEICTASFIDNSSILIGSSEEVIDDEIKDLPPNHIAILQLETMAVTKLISPKTEFGNLFSINESLAWDLYKYPKLIDLNTGEIIVKYEEIDSGLQNSAIMNSKEYLPQICYNQHTKSIAISGHDKIYVLVP